jgi:signal peptidase I
MRRGVELVSGVLIAVLVMQTWFVDGLFAPLVISGGSMAETLLGCHRSLICDDCGRAMVCGRDSDPPAARAICPNCGHANELANRADMPGDRVLLDKAIFQVRSPRRWEVVAFRDPRQPDQVSVKRVVGLPGETIEIRDGDVYADGRIQRKAFEKQRAMAVLVHDAGRQPTLDSSTPPRWRPDRAESTWESTEGRFTHPEIDDEDRADWLTYHHVGRVGGQWQPCPITDVCSYNASQPRRVEDVHEMTDLLLSLQVTSVVGKGILSIGATDGSDRFEVRIFPARRQFEVWWQGATAPEAKGNVKVGLGGLRVEVSLFDQQFCVAFDGRTVVALPYEPRTRARRPNAAPFSIGSRSLGVVVEDVRVYRDVHYTHPIGLLNCWALDRPAKLGGDAFFVLGDNSPISEDSRVGADHPGVSASLLVGKPFLAIFSLHGVSFGPWHFQVPNPAGIRYIR